MSEENQENNLAEELVEETKEDSEKSEEPYVDLTKEESAEEEKFQEVLEKSNEIKEPNIDEIVEHKEAEETETTSDEIPEIEPKSETEEKIVPEATANIIEDEKLIFTQYLCENCDLKFYVNRLDENKLGDKLKCYNCGKKKIIKKRLLDVTLNAYKDYEEQ